MRKDNGCTLLYLISILCFFCYLTDKFAFYLQKKTANEFMITMLLIVSLSILATVISGYIIKTLLKLAYSLLPILKKQSSKFNRLVNIPLFLIIQLILITLLLSGYIRFNHYVANNFLVGLSVALTLVIGSVLVTIIINHYANPLIQFSQTSVINLKKFLNWFFWLTNQIRFGFLYLFVYLVCSILLLHPVTYWLTESDPKRSQTRLFLLLYLIIPSFALINSLWIYPLFAHLHKRFSFFKKLDTQRIKAKIPARFYPYILISFAVFIISIITDLYRQ